MKNRWKRIRTGILTALLVGALGTAAFALAAPDLTRTGSISMTMKYEGKPVSGGNLMMYQVGTAEETNGSYSFVCSGDFAECGYSLTDIKSQKLMDQLLRYINENSNTVLGTTRQISKDGTVSFGNLQPGVYLLRQTRAADGYECIEPFLVTIPLTIDGTYEYDVDASAKMSPISKTASGSTGGSSSSGGNSSSGSPGSKLPKTGQLNWPIPVLTISGLLLFAFGWFLKYGTMSNRHEG